MARTRFLFTTFSFYTSVRENDKKKERTQQPAPTLCRLFFVILTCRFYSEISCIPNCLLWSPFENTFLLTDELVT